MDELQRRQVSQRQEKRVAERLGLRVTPNSGATLFLPGDIAGKGCLFECKTIVRPAISFRIKKIWMTKIAKEAFQKQAEVYGLIFDFGDGMDYVVLPLDVYDQLRKGLDDARGT